MGNKLDSSVVFAFDKFRGTATSVELANTGRNAATAAGWKATSVALADGGEGSLDVLGGANKYTTVSGPLGAPVEAGWRLDGKTAFIEMAAASGLVLAGGAGLNDPMGADTTGTGQLITKAVELGARRVVVLLGGSATTDGGLGAIDAMPNPARLKEIELVAACDVETLFVDAAAVFGPQKGASAPQVSLLTRRLERLSQLYHNRYSVDVSSVRGAGAAGGLAGGIVAVGGRIESGFEILAEHARLDEHLESADLVVTGEGLLDAGSFDGKVVGGVHRWATEQGVPVVAIVGNSRPDVPQPENLKVVSLTEIYGEQQSMANTLALVEEQLATVLS